MTSGSARLTCAWFEATSLRASFLGDLAMIGGPPWLNLRRFASGAAEEDDDDDDDDDGDDDDGGGEEEEEEEEEDAPCPSASPCPFSPSS